MDTRLSEKRAKINIILIGIFYLVSGVWEYLMGSTQAESISPNTYFLLDMYRSYATIIGLITIFVGLGILSRISIARLLGIILSWWSLFVSPLIEIWWNLYSISIKKFLVTDSWSALWIQSGIIILIYTSVRLYIIYMLRISKVGYIFLKGKQLKSNNNS